MVTVLCILRSITERELLQKSLVQIDLKKFKKVLFKYFKIKAAAHFKVKP